MRIYLLNAPYLTNFTRCGRWQGVAGRGGTLYYPIWLAYATGLLEKEGHTVRLIDAVARKWDNHKVTEDVAEFKPDLIVVDSNFSSLKNDINVANRLKASSNATTILVGPPANIFSEDILNRGVDIVARLEYDYTLRDLAQAIQKGESLNGIKGISYRENDHIIHNPDREYTTSEELDYIPFVSKVYKEHLIVRDYFLSHAYFPMVLIFTTRGCPNQCTFCSWPENLMGRKYRSRSINNIVDEFEYIVKELPEVEEIIIEDDSFTINKDRVLQICEELNRRNIHINWGCQSRATLDIETMKAMKKAGCHLLDVGYESGNDEILQNIQKGTTVQQLREFTKNARKAKLKILADFVIGFPGENKDTANNTIKLMKELRPDLVQISVATPIPGTDFYRWVKEKGYILSEDLESSIDFNGFQKCIISYPELTSEEIQNIVDKSLKEYYLSVHYIPIAIKNVFSRGGLNELKMLIRSVSGFVEYLRRDKQSV
jgi:radical SAM superfamily enzyme YgiQ (UPF0313 family)